MSIFTTQGWAPGRSAQQREKRRDMLGTKTGKQTLRVSDLDYVALAIPHMEEIAETALPSVARLNDSSCNEQPPQRSACPSEGEIGRTRAFG